MKTIKLLVLLLSISAWLFTSCTKEDNTPDPGKEPQVEVNPPTETGDTLSPSDYFSIKTTSDGSLIIGEVKNVYAGNGVKHGDTSGGLFTKFDFSTGIGKPTESETEWDIAFKATTIVFNGGSKVIEKGANEPERNGNAAAYITDAYMKDITIVDVEALKQDSKQGWAIPIGSGNGWYTYSRQTHIVTAAPKKTILLRTRDGKHYVKLEILSYYKDFNDSTEDLSTTRYYTFNYVYQTVDNETEFKPIPTSILN